jgi:DNA-binding IclR family transcriptional regulator
MKNELLEIKKIFQIVLTQCKSGITVEDLAHEASYSEEDTLNYLLYLTKADLVRSSENYYFPTDKAFNVASNAWYHV